MADKKAVGELNGRWAWIFKLALVLVPITATATGAVIGVTYNNANRLTAIEANRFTAADGLEVWKEIAKIREEMATIPRENPPAWFVARMDCLETQIRDLSKVVNQHIGMHQPEGSSP